VFEGLVCYSVTMPPKKLEKRAWAGNLASYRARTTFCDGKRGKPEPEPLGRPGPRFAGCDCDDLEAGGAGDGEDDDDDNEDDKLRMMMMMMRMMMMMMMMMMMILLGRMRVGGHFGRHHPRVCRRRPRSPHKNQRC
jgi:hypothetical protein